MTVECVWVEDSLTGQDAVGQAALVRSGELTAVELVDAAIARVARANGKLNVLAAQDFELAREEAKNVRAGGQGGPLAGVPTLIKDLLPYPGLPCGFGSRALAGHVAPEVSDYARAVADAGLIVLGKSTTSEFGLLGTTQTLAHGVTPNPWDLARSPGGSSGGAVAAVASGMVPVAHASDGGGSIRGPASLCGLFGFKPSRKRERSTGPMSDSPFGQIISEHCVSRTVRDSAAWLAVTERPEDAVGFVREPLRRRLRIGWYAATAFGAQQQADVAAGLQRTVALCAELGHVLVPVAGPRFDAEAASAAFFQMGGASMGMMLGQLRGAGVPVEQLVEPFTLELARRAGPDPMQALGQAGAVLQQAAAGIARALEGIDVLLCPTVPFPAWPQPELDPAGAFEDIVAFTNRLAGFTAPASLAGWCAMSVPLCESDGGLPVGMHFAAGAGQDALLLGLAYELELAAPWRQRHPGWRARGTAA